MKGDTNTAKRQQEPSLGNPCPLLFPLIAVHTCTPVESASLCFLSIRSYLDVKSRHTPPSHLRHTPRSIDQLPTYSLTLTRSLTQSLTRSLHSRSLVTLPICSSNTSPNLCRPCKYTHAHLISIRFALLGLVTPSSFSSPPLSSLLYHHHQSMSRIFVYC